MQKLTRLVYVSSIADQVRPNLAAVVSQVLATSRANNAAVGVTGMLLTYGGHFVQVLEGDESKVQTTLARVSRDPRHTRIHVLGRQFVSERSFARWAMCANDLSARDDDILAVLDQRGAFSPYTMGPVAALRLLTTIAGIQGRPLQAA